MKIIFNKYDLKKVVNYEKDLGFVPTMGALHIGHISLIKKSLKVCNKTIVSIFVNKPQFNKSFDYKKYPRVLSKDMNILKKLRVNFLYLPKSKEIYPNGRNKNISINQFKKRLCGKFRPGHFEAIADVIDRFIYLIKPKKIFLGEKDMQQLKIIQHFVKKNHPKINVVGCKTIREKNGIACSSRNALLNDCELKIASNVYNFLKNKKKSIRNSKKLYFLKKEIIKLGVRKIDYLEILDINKLIKPFKKKSYFRIFIAYYLGTTRLIDNI